MFVLKTVSIEAIRPEEVDSVFNEMIDITSYENSLRQFAATSPRISLKDGRVLIMSSEELRHALAGGGRFHVLGPYGDQGPQTREEWEAEQEAEAYYESFY